MQRIAKVIKLMLSAFDNPLEVEKKVQNQRTVVTIQVSPPDWPNFPKIVYRAKKFAEIGPVFAHITGDLNSYESSWYFGAIP